MTNKILFFFIMTISCWQLGEGSYIYMKANIAQYLLNSAWSKTLQGETEVKPWSWADTHPIAKITFNNNKDHFIVLSGASGRTMAFGPGHVSATPLPGNGGNSVVAGHRDTHFSTLKNLSLGDLIQVKTPTNILEYEITNSLIVDQSQSEVMQDYGFEMLTLITCYPFNAIQAGGPLRYVIQARLL